MSDNIILNLNEVIHNLERTNPIIEEWENDIAQLQPAMITDDVEIKRSASQAMFATSEDMLGDFTDVLNNISFAADNVGQLSSGLQVPPAAVSTYNTAARKFFNKVHRISLKGAKMDAFLSAQELQEMQSDINNYLAATEALRDSVTSAAVITA